jgi:hypothetical protein
MSQQRFSPEFKDEAVRQVTEKGPDARLTTGPSSAGWEHAESLRGGMPAVRECQVPRVQGGPVAARRVPDARALSEASPTLPIEGRAPSCSQRLNRGRRG